MTTVWKHGEVAVRVRVLEKSEIARGVFEFEFGSNSGDALPDWSPGAHIDLHLPNGISRQYSLMRGRDASNWRIAVLVEEQGRGGSIFLRDNIEVGDQLDIVGPRNHFHMSDSETYLFIAGGIGVTPLIPMLEYAESQGKDWRLIYLGRSLETMAYSSELKALYDGKVVLAPKDSYGRFSLADQIANTPSGTSVFACGPERLLKALELEMGDRLANLHLERFHPKELDAPHVNKPFTVYCQRSQVEISVEAEESLLMAADFAGVEISGDCMEGTCGACETRVIEGVVEHRDSVLSFEDQQKSEKMMICVSRAKGQKLILDL